MLTYSDCRLGIIDTVEDQMYVMDDFGTLIRVPFCFGYHYFQEI